MRKLDKFIKPFMCIVLSVCILFSVSDFRKGVNAEVITAITVGGIAVSAAAFGYLVSQIEANGISVPTVSDGKVIVEDWLTSQRQIMDEDEFAAYCKSLGLTYDSATGIDVPAGAMISYTQDPITGNYSMGYYIPTPVDYIQSLGGGVVQAVKTGVVTSYDVLTNVGTALYDWLHSSTNVEYIAPVSSYIGNLSGIKSDLNSLYIIRAKQLFDKDITDNFCSSSNFTGWEYYDLYYGGPYADGSKTWYASYVLGYNQSDNSCRLYSGGFVYYSDSSLSRWKLYARGEQTRPEVFDISYSISSGSGYTVKLSQLKRIRHYVNTDVLTEQSSDIDYVAEQASLKIGDNEFSLNSDSNVWDSSDVAAVGAYADGAVGSDGKVVVGVAGVASDGETFEKDGPVILNPGTTVVSSGSAAPTVPDTVSSSSNILDWVKDFFTNFFSRLKSLLLGLFTVSEGFLPGWFDRFQAVFDSKGYDFDFSYLNRAKETSIPDIYITWYGQKILFMPSDYIYSCAEVARPFIRAFIYFIILLHDRKRLIYLIRGSLPPEADFDVVSPRGR